MLKFYYIFLFSILSISNLRSQINQPYLIKNNNIKLKWIEPNNSINKVGKYDKLEFGIQLNQKLTNQINDFIQTSQGGINPFNPDEISVEVKFISPSLKESVIYGFYYQSFVRIGEGWKEEPTNYNWRVRFCNDEIGKWKLEVSITTKYKSMKALGTTFLCISSSNKGRLKISSTERTLHLN